MTLENSTLKSLNLLINSLADLISLLSYYYNYKGERIEISTDVKAAILSSMGIELTEQSLRYWIEYFKNSYWKKVVEPVYVTGENTQIFLYGKENLQRYAEIEIVPLEEIGFESEKFYFPIKIGESDILESKNINDETYYKYKISLPKIPIGYYKMKIFLKKRDFKSFLIVCPEESFIPIGNKTWGMHINLWSLRDGYRESDFSHVREFAEYVKGLEGFVSLSPLHFNDPLDPYGRSPYSALSRQFKTPLYVSEISVDEKDSKFFDYETIWKEKLSKLREKFKKISSEEWENFQQYKNNLPILFREDLKYFAVFSFLREKLGNNWQSWDLPFKNPEIPLLEEIYKKNEGEILFYEYLQWLVEKELNDLNKYKLCLDLGFGSTKQSFDVWINREIYALEAEYGAPPDDFNPRGQKWGFPPIIPFRLSEKAYLPFIKILRANMKATLLRIDHALGLFRAFWIPQGRDPSEGAYVKYPWNDLISIICLESHLNKVGIIGEDLGTAEEWMREELMKRKISSWKVFYFEKDFLGYRDYSEYPENSLCSITTHDLPTFKGFWLGKDIELRKNFSLFDDLSFNKAIEERRKDKKRIMKLLLKYEKIEAHLASLLLSIIKFLSMTKSKYFLVYPEDLLLIEEQTNFPGTTTEYPNWQRKIPITVDEFLNLPIMKKLETILKETGRIPAE